MKTPVELSATLAACLKKADFDRAFEALEGEAVIDILQRAGSLKLRLANMICDTLDYAGRYKMVKEVLRHIPEPTRIDKFLREPAYRLDAVEAAELKDEAWAVIHHGMHLYRAVKYDEALHRFENARDALERIEANAAEPNKTRCTGSLARAFYCIGLAYRQMAKGRTAREAFSTSIALAWKGITERTKANESSDYFDFHIAKCFGMGEAWLAYNEASLTIAEDYIVAARRLLQLLDPNKNKVKCIHAYIEIIHASVITSRSSDTRRLDEAIDILKKSYSDLGGESALKSERSGHQTYALRALVELARAYLDRARSEEDARGDYLAKAREHAVVARDSIAAQNDSRTCSNAWIIESRVSREENRHTDALEKAQKALEIGGSGQFSRIDCWITLGEAQYWTDNYSEAVKSFRKAQEYGASNRKVVAVTQLHLANTFLRWSRPAEARECFAAWDSTRVGVENAFIRSFAARVRLKLREFVITVDQITREIDSGKKTIVKDHVKALEKWIAEVALAKAEGRRPLAAAYLDVVPATLASYLEYTDPK